MTDEYHSLRRKKSPVTPTAEKTTPPQSEASFWPHEAIGAKMQ
jgi:hypothetical protein